MFTTRRVSGLLCVANFVCAAVYLDAAMGLFITLVAFLSTFVIWNANLLAATKTDYYVRKDGYPLDDQGIIIDTESPPGCVSAMGWLFLIAITIYTAILVL